MLGQKLVNLICGDQTSEIKLIATSKGPNRNITQSGYEYCNLDLTNRDDLCNVIGNYRPEMIINTAAMTNVDQCESEKDACWNLNVGAVETLIDICQENNCKLIHLSTDFIFDGLAGPYTEEADPHPLSYYGESKLASEQLILDSNIDWAIARTVLVFGIVNDMSRSNIALWVKDSLEKGKHLKIVNDQWRTPTLADDLAEGCYLIARKRAKGIFNISGKELLTPYEMAMKTAIYFGLDQNLIEKVDASSFTQVAKRPAKTGFIIDKAHRELGYNPRSFDEGLEIVSAQLALIDTKN